MKPACDPTMNSVPTSRAKRSMTTLKKKRRVHAPQYVMRVNILLTQEQFVKLHDWAREEGRPVPNLIRRLIDLGIAERK